MRQSRMLLVQAVCVLCCCTKCGWCVSGIVGSKTHLKALWDLCLIGRNTDLHLGLLAADFQPKE